MFRQLGPGELFLIILVFGVLGFWLWAIVDAASTPRQVWEAAGQNQPLWIVLTILLGVLGACLYVLAARPMLRRAKVHVR